MPAQTLLEQSNAQKAEANKFFGSARYSQAIGEYGKALSSCPSYLEYEIAVLKSNTSACHLKLEDWKAAIESANAALDALVRLEPTSTANDEKSGEADDGVVELEGEGEDADKELAKLKMSDQRKQDIRRIKVKALMRRARAKSEEGGWGNLQGADEGARAPNQQSGPNWLISWWLDYRELASMSDLPSQDKKVVHQALSVLPARINQAKEKELGDMMGKLKEVCLRSNYWAIY